MSGTEGALRLHFQSLPRCRQYMFPDDLQQYLESWTLPIALCLKPASWKPAVSKGVARLLKKSVFWHILFLLLRMFPHLFLFPLLLGSI